MSHGGTPPGEWELLDAPFSELRDPILIYFFLKKVDELNLVVLFFGGFLDQRGPSIQSDLDKRVAIFDTKNILDKRPTSDA